MASRMRIAVRRFTSNCSSMSAKDMPVRLACISRASWIMLSVFSYLKFLTPRPYHPYMTNSGTLHVFYVIVSAMGQTTREICEAFAPRTLFSNVSNIGTHKCYMEHNVNIWYDCNEIHDARNHWRANSSPLFEHRTNSAKSIEERQAAHSTPLRARQPKSQGRGARYIYGYQSLTHRFWQTGV